MKTVITVMALCAMSTTLFSQDNLLFNALKKFSLDSATVGYRPQAAWGVVDRADPFRLNYFDGLLARPLKIPNFTRDMLWRYNVWLTNDTMNYPSPRLAKVKPLAATIMHSARNLGYDIGKYGFEYTPHIAERNPLLEVLTAIHSENGRDMGTNIVYPLPTQDWTNVAKRIEAQIKLLPVDLQKTLASIVEAIREAAKWRNLSLKNIPRTQWRHVFESTTLEESVCDAHTFDQIVYDAALAFDGHSCHYGAMLLAQAIEQALPELQRHAGRNLELDIPTPVGRIRMTGSKSDVHYAQDCALLIDLGGNDTYNGSAAASNPDLPVSVFIDLSGDDRYVNAHEGIPSQGAGVLGIGMLLDLGGSDSYESKTFSQGCGRFGVGMIYDTEGDDRYTSLGFSQGAGMYGIGCIVDDAGDDEYRTVYYAQGYGFARGLGMIADLQGNDKYIADDTNLIHVGDQTPKHNESNAQGFASGRRADHTDGHNMSGGIGIINDLAGDDEYFAGTFSQGSSYWYGYGILSDHSGDDTYRGVFFNLGASAHFGIGVLFDDAGNDKTDLVMTLGIGSAHDGSAAFYIDLNGDDTYTMSNADDRATSLGGALNGSFALFANIRGNDRYAPVGNALGYGSSRRGGEWPRFAPTTGIFIDIGGNDSYNHKGTAAKNNTDWITNDDKVLGVYGYGIDVEQGMIRFEIW